MILLILGAILIGGGISLLVDAVQEWCDKVDGPVRRYEMWFDGLVDGSTKRKAAEAAKRKQELWKRLHNPK